MEEISGLEQGSGMGVRDRVRVKVELRVQVQGTFRNQLEPCGRGSGKEGVRGSEGPKLYMQEA